MFNLFSSIGSLFSGDTLRVMSAGMNLIGGVSGSSSASSHARMISAIGDREALQTLRAAELDAERLVRDGQRTIGFTQARAGAGNLQMRGSIMDIVANSYGELEMDRLITLYNAKREASLIQERAKANAKATRAEGRSKLTRSIGSAALELAGSGLFTKQEL